MAGPGELGPNGPGLRFWELLENEWLGVQEEQGLAKTEEAAAGMDFPFPRGSVLPLSQAPPGQGRGTGGRAASQGARAGEGLGLPGPGSGPQPEGQGWSWRTGELKEKCVMNGKDPGSVQLVCPSIHTQFLQSV